MLGEGGWARYEGVPFPSLFRVIEDFATRLLPAL